MSKKTRIIFFIIGLGIFIYLVTKFGFNNILINIEKIGWWFIPIVTVWGIVYLFNSFAWYTILNGKKNGIRFHDLLSVSISGFAINYITPFINLGGEPYRVIALRNSIGIHNSVSSVILYRMIHILGSFFFWLTGAVVVAILLPLSSELKISLFAVSFVLIILILFFFSRHKKGIFKAVLNLLSKIKFLNKIYLKLLKREKTLLIIDDQIKDLYLNRKSAFYLALFSEYIGRIIASLEFYFILIAIGLNSTIIQAFFINVGSSIIMNVLFFIPFELGTREGSLYFILESLGFTAGVGIFIALVNRIREFFWILIGLLLMQIKGNVTAEKKDLLDYI
jgi:uncharacterized protein (TIRG00374 family)